jgi:hypothetical protein
MSFFVAAVVTTVASVAYSYSQSKKAKKAAEAAAEQAKEASRGTQVPSNLSGGALDIAYGVTKVGGYQVFARTKSNVIPAIDTSSHDFFFNGGIDFTSSYSGSKNEFLFLQQVLTAKGISSVEGLEIDDLVITQEALTTNPELEKINGYFGISVNFNGSNANNFILRNYPERQNSLFTDLSYLSACFRINRDEPQFSGIPSISLTVKGKKIREVQKQNNSYVLGNYYFTSNSAEILLDYLLEFAKVPITEINLKSFYDAKVICNKVVDNKILGGLGYSTPLFRKGYASANTSVIYFDVIPSDLVVGQYVSCSEPGLQSGSKIVSINLSEKSITIDKLILSNIGTADSFQNEFQWAWDQNGESFLQAVSVPVPGDKKLFTIEGKQTPIKLYEFNGLLSTESDYRNNIETILNTMDNALLLWSEGQYKLSLAYPEREEDIPIVATITDDDILENNINIIWPDIESKYNNVEVTYRNSSQNFKSDSVYALEVQ